MEMENEDHKQWSDISLFAHYPFSIIHYQFPDRAPLLDYRMSFLIQSYRSYPVTPHYRQQPCGYPAGAAMAMMAM
jgi:hypothetical protein